MSFVEAFMSSSDQKGHRSPLVVSMIMIGASVAWYRAMSAMWSRGSFGPPTRGPVIAAVPQVCRRSRPGTNVRTSEPGEKPSLRFHSVGSIGLPTMLRGISASWKSTRFFVAVVASGFVK
ncbi:MAG: hypothetical protein E6G68_01385 [Actinobacteria bacterium]|nr:MAG: hypothetical protein E6G68_01385 [Actinomycetota bacterium]